VKALALAAAIGLAGCLSPSTSTIGGYEVGSRTCYNNASIDPSGTMTCEQFVAFARQQIDGGEPSHPPIAATEVYRDPVGYDYGGYGLRAYVVFRLDDASTRVFWIQCGVGLSKDMCIPATPVGG